MVTEPVDSGNQQIFKKENPYMPRSRLITKEEFDSCPRDFSFNFHFNSDSDSGAWSVYLQSQDGNLRIMMESPFDAASELTQEQKDNFGIEDEGRRLIYPKLTTGNPLENVQGNEAKTEQGLPRSYYIDELKPRRTEVSKEQLVQLSPEEFAQIIKETQGEGIIFYTGAGISTVGEEPVWSMTDLKAQIGLSDEGKEFASLFRESPDILLKRVAQFRDSLFADSTTPAHTAIAEIVRSKPEVIILTENIDLKPEAEGSRVSVIHMDSDSEAFTDVKLRARAARVLVTVGLSHDDRAIIEYLKRKNPDLKIVTLTLEPPDYLDEKDFVMLGNCHEILPKVAKLVTQSTISEAV